MEYRLVRKKSGKEIEIFREEDSEKIGQITKQRFWLVLTKYNLDLEGSNSEIRPNLLTRRKWRVGDVVISLKWKLLGKGISIRFANVAFAAKDFVKGKLVFKDIDQGRTGLIVNTNLLKNNDSVIIEHYDRFELGVSVLTTMLAMKRYNINNW